VTLTWPTVLWGAAGAAALVRAFWNPARVVTDAPPLGCPGMGCDPGLMFGPSSASMYAVTSGRVHAMDPTLGLQIVSRVEPVLVTYQGWTALDNLRVGQDVRLGQNLGQALRGLTFAVQQIQPGGKLVPLEPASWLAARGLKPSSVASPLWCAQGRKILVPRAVASCGFRLPDPSSVMLLPVSTMTE